jgi:hypothetical protein
MLSNMFLGVEYILKSRTFVMFKRDNNITNNLKI